MKYTNWVYCICINLLGIQKCPFPLTHIFKYIENFIIKKIKKGKEIYATPQPFPSIRYGLYKKKRINPYWKSKTNKKKVKRILYRTKCVCRASTTSSASVFSRRRVLTAPRCKCGGRKKLEHYWSHFLIPILPHPAFLLNAPKRCSFN